MGWFCPTLGSWPTRVPDLKYNLVSEFDSNKHLLDTYSMAKPTKERMASTSTSTAWSS